MDRSDLFLQLNFSFPLSTDEDKLVQLESTEKQQLAIFELFDIHTCYYITNHVEKTNIERYARLSEIQLTWLKLNQIFNELLEIFKFVAFVASSEQFSIRRYQETKVTKKPLKPLTILLDHTQTSHSHRRSRDHFYDKKKTTHRCTNERQLVQLESQMRAIHMVGSTQVLTHRDRHARIYSHHGRSFSYMRDTEEKRGEACCEEDLRLEKLLGIVTGNV
ncbi:hypothetical protein DBV15_07817 [Temnothorax longispinosus]|uniref:Uncharacterized protein n=1 Tax=Temnothorax longispinosus TaxID=300112 RepID=A0A4S2K662_9HYME|nr:hypothetical protein DBV15_07817 [Temnothorax longispinosus]